MERSDVGNRERQVQSQRINIRQMNRSRNVIKNNDSRNWELKGIV